MSDRNVSLFRSLRREEHTGENRCLPCTVVNVAIAVALAGVLAFVALELAVLVFLASLLAIYLRGYLVPGTPTLTKRYLPHRVLAMFDKHPDESDPTEQWETLQKLEEYERNAVEPEEFLRDIGAIEPCDEPAGICYTDAFEQTLRAALDEFAVDADENRPSSAGDSADTHSTGHIHASSFAIDVGTLGDIYDVDPSDIEVQERESPAITVGRRVRKWPSGEVLALDAATHSALKKQSERWETVPQKQRIEILQELRALAESCPGCGGAIVTSNEVVESCCAEYEVVAIRCGECGAHLLERDPEKRGGNVGGFDP